MKNNRNFTNIIALIISASILALFYMQKETITSFKNNTDQLKKRLDNYYRAQKNILDEIRSIQASISNLNLSIKDKTLILAEHNMRLNEMEQAYLKTPAGESNDYSDEEVKKEKYYIEKIQESESFFSDLFDSEGESADFDASPSDLSAKKFEEKILYFLSPDDYLRYQKSFIGSPEEIRLSYCVRAISDTAVTQLSVQQKVQLTIAAFEETEEIKQTYGTDYNIPEEDFDEIILIRAKDFLSDSQYTALKEFVKS